MSIVFLTGGSGFVGRNLIRALVASGYRVKALARSERSAEVVRQLGAEPVIGDLLDEQVLRIGLQGAAAMIHAAADTDHGGDDPVQDRVNVEGTRLVFRLAREAGVRRALQISTESVLADGAPIIEADEAWPIPARHAGGYARTKAAAERAALAEAGEGFVVCAIRPRFVWGRDDTSALPEIIDAVKSGRLKWIAGGHYRTSTAHVANVAAGALAALERGQTGQVYFITDGAPQEFRAFLTRMLATHGVAPPTGSVPRWLLKSVIAVGAWLQQLTGGRIKPPISRQEYATVGHEVTVRDDRARRELGYVPVISVAEGLAEMAPGGQWSPEADTLASTRPAD